MLQVRLERIKARRVQMKRLLAKLVKARKMNDAEGARSNWAAMRPFARGNRLDRRSIRNIMQKDVNVLIERNASQGFLNHAMSAQ